MLPAASRATAPGSVTGQRNCITTRLTERLQPDSFRPKCSEKRAFLNNKELLPKWASGHILRPLTCPPLQTKVSQVEIEAGDCEGRLPLLFLRVICQWSVVSCTCASVERRP